MIEITDKTHNLIYTFTLDKVLESVKRDGVVIWNKDSKTPQYISNFVYKELSKH